MKYNISYNSIGGLQNVNTSNRLEPNNGNTNQEEKGQEVEYFDSDSENEQLQNFNTSNNGNTNQEEKEQEIENSDSEDEQLPLQLQNINITNYIFTSKNELQTAVDLWCSNKQQAIEDYGDINTWNVSQIEDMSYLFFNKSKFDDDISNWDVSKVKNMEYMFFGAKKFNKNLNYWDVRNVSNMNSMFGSAGKFNNSIGYWPINFDCSTHNMFFFSGINSETFGTTNTDTTEYIKEFPYGYKIAQELKLPGYWEIFISNDNYIATEKKNEIFKSSENAMVEVGPYDTILNLMKIVENKYGLVNEEHIIKFNDKELNENTNLLSNDIKNKSILFYYNLYPDDVEIDVIVTYLNSNNLGIFKVKKDTYIYELKYKIYKLKNIRVEEHDLYYFDGKKILENDKTIKYYKIKNGAKFNIVLYTKPKDLGFDFRKWLILKDPNYYNQLPPPVFSEKIEGWQRLQKLRENQLNLPQLQRENNSDTKKDLKRRLRENNSDTKKDLKRRLRENNSDTKKDLTLREWRDNNSVTKKELKRRLRENNSVRQEDLQRKKDP